MVSLENKMVFITGASSGIGKSCARAFAEQGARLILAARRLERLEDLAVELKRKPGQDILLLSLDVRKQPAVERAVNGLPAEWAAIDVLVNNAGLSRGLDKIHEGKLEDWEEMIDANIKGLLMSAGPSSPGW